MRTPVAILLGWSLLQFAECSDESGSHFGPPSSITRVIPVYGVCLDEATGNIVVGALFGDCSAGDSARVDSLLRIESSQSTIEKYLRNHAYSDLDGRAVLQPECDLTYYEHRIIDCAFREIRLIAYQPGYYAWRFDARLDSLKRVTSPDGSEVYYFVLSPVRLRRK